jgi:hypothetical protein
MKKMLAGSLLALLLGAAFFLFSSCAENRRTPLQQSAPPSTANGKPVEPTVFPGEASAPDVSPSPAASDEPDILETAPPTPETLKPPSSPAESFLSVPISITADEAGRILEDALTNPLYDIKGQTIDQSYGESVADLLLEKTGRVKVSFAKNKANFSLPFRFSSMVSWKGRILGISSSTRKEIFGAGTLHLTLAPSIDKSWKLRLNGSVGLEWTRSPSLNVLGQEIGIASLLTDLFNKRSGELLSRAEEEINRSARIREYAQKEWAGLHQPIPLGSSPELWLAVAPLSVSMPPFSAEDGRLTATAGIKCMLKITAEKPDPLKATPLPALAAMPPHMEPGILLNVDSTLSYASLGKYVSSMDFPEVDIPGGGRVMVKEVSFFGNGDKLVAAADISGKGPVGGAIEGKIYIMGRPTYSREDEVIRMEDADFEERTNSALAKAAAWLARPALLKEMTERMVFPLQELREQTVRSLAELLREQKIAEDVLMEGSVSALSLESLAVGEDGLRLSLSLGGAVSLRYEDESLKRKEKEEKKGGKKN